MSVPLNYGEIWLVFNDADGVKNGSTEFSLDALHG